MADREDWTCWCDSSIFDSVVWPLLSEKYGWQREVLATADAGADSGSEIFYPPCTTRSVRSNSRFRSTRSRKASCSSREEVMQSLQWDSASYGSLLLDAEAAARERDETSKKHIPLVHPSATPLPASSSGGSSLSPTCQHKRRKKRAAAALAPVSPAPRRSVRPSRKSARVGRLKVLSMASAEMYDSENEGAQDEKGIWESLPVEFTSNYQPVSNSSDPVLIVSSSDEEATERNSVVDLSTGTYGADQENYIKPYSFVSHEVLGDGIMIKKCVRRGKWRKYASMYEVLLSWGRAYLPRNQLETLPEETLLVYPSRSAPQVLFISRGDALRLYPGMFLNDTNIDFYLRYIDPGNERIKIFSPLVYGYVQLLAQSLKLTAQSVEDRWARIHKWIPAYEIFGSELLIFPVNDHTHWSLAVVCNLCQVREAAATMKALQAEREARKGAAATLRARDGARSAESHAKDAEGEPQVSAAEDVAEGLRRDDLPCILLLDSAKAHRSQTVFYAIRRFLSLLWERKIENDKGTLVMDATTLPGFSLQVPRQENDCDCGVFLLKFVEILIKSRLRVTPDFLESRGAKGNPLSEGCEGWFDQQHIYDKREEMRQLLVRLAFEQRQEALQSESTPEPRAVRRRRSSWKAANSDAGSEAPLPSLSANPNEPANFLEERARDVAEAAPFPPSETYQVSSELDALHESLSPCPAAEVETLSEGGAGALRAGSDSSPAPAVFKGEPSLMPTEASPSLSQRKEKFVLCGGHSTPPAGDGISTTSTSAELALDEVNHGCSKASSLALSDKRTQEVGEEGCTPSLSEEVSGAPVGLKQGGVEAGNHCSEEKASSSESSALRDDRASFSICDGELEDFAPSSQEAERTQNLPVSPPAGDSGPSPARRALADAASVMLLRL